MRLRPLRIKWAIVLVVVSIVFLMILTIPWWSPWALEMWNLFHAQANEIQFIGATLALAFLVLGPVVRFFNRHVAQMNQREQAQELALMQRFAKRRLITTTERYNVASVYRLTASYWTNILVHYDRILADESSMERLSGAIRHYLPADSRAIIDPSLLGCGSIHQVRLVSQICNRLGLRVTEFDFRSSLSAIVGTLNPAIVGSLQVYADRLDHVVIIFGPGAEEIKRALGQFAGRTSIVMSVDDLATLDVKDRWGMINAGNSLSD